MILDILTIFQFWNDLRFVNMKSDHNSANWNCTISPSSKRDHQLQVWSFSSSFDYFSAGRDIPPHFHHKSCLQSQHFLKNPRQDVSSGNPWGPPSQPSLPLLSPFLSLSPASQTNILSNSECQYNFYYIQFSSMCKVEGNSGIIDTAHITLHLNNISYWDLKYFFRV